MTAEMMWNVSDNPVCERAKKKLFNMPASATIRVSRLYGESVVVSPSLDALLAYREDTSVATCKEDGFC